MHEHTHTHIHTHTHTRASPQRSDIHLTSIVCWCSPLCLTTLTFAAEISMPNKWPFSWGQEVSTCWLTTQRSSAGISPDVGGPVNMNVVLNVKPGLTLTFHLSLLNKELFLVVTFPSSSSFPLQSESITEGELLRLPPPLRARLKMMRWSGALWFFVFFFALADTGGGAVSQQLSASLHT